MNGHIAFEIFSTEDENDSTLEVGMEAQNELVSIKFTFYVVKQSFTKFGEDLIIFPKDINDKFMFQMGQDDSSWAFFGLIEGRCHSNGKVTLKLLTDNHGKESEEAKTYFFIDTYPAYLAKLGKLIKEMNKVSGTRIDWYSNT